MPATPGRKPSAILSLRVPKSLHARIVELAAQEGVTLNHLCSNLLTKAVVKDMLAQGIDPDDVLSVLFQHYKPEPTGGQR